MSKTNSTKNLSY